MTEYRVMYSYTHNDSFSGGGADANLTIKGAPTKQSLLNAIAAHAVSDLATAKRIGNIIEIVNLDNGGSQNFIFPVTAAESNRALVGALTNRARTVADINPSSSKAPKVAAAFKENSLGVLNDALSSRGAATVQGGASSGRAAASSSSGKSYLNT